MTGFREQDLTGAHFERVSLRGATTRAVDDEWSVTRTPAALNEEWEQRLHTERQVSLAKA